MRASIPSGAQTGVVIACILGLSVSVSTILLVSFPVFFAPLAHDFGWTRGQLSIAFSTAGLSLALATPVVGRLVAKFGVRAVLLSAIPCFAAAFASGSIVIGSFPSFAIWAAIAGLLGAATNTFVYLSILPAWFPNRLGLALGITMSGIGLGHAVCPLLTTYLIEAYGWREAYRLLALLCVSCALPGVLLFVRMPRLAPTSRSVDAESPVSVVPAPGWTDPRLLLFGGAFLLIALCASGAAVHIIPIFQDKGLSAREAASYASASGVTILVSRLVIGFLLDRIRMQYIAIFNCLCAASIPLVLLSPTPVILAVAAPILAGLALGTEGDLMPFVVKKVFGLEVYAVIYSRLFTFYSIGILIGPTVMGVAYDAFGNYDRLLITLSVLMIGALTAFLYASRMAGRVGGPEDRPMASQTA